MPTFKNMFYIRKIWTLLEEPLCDKTATFTLKILKQSESRLENISSQLIDHF